MDKKTEHIQAKLGLLGRNISYSFSRAYFSKKFADHALPFTYENFDIDSLSLLPNIIKSEPLLKGLNVTIPFKEDVFEYLDTIDETAKAIGAVNTISISDSNILTGYNTDWYGFKTSITPYLEKHHKNALILGTGGASKAIAYALKHLGITYSFVSRTKGELTNFLYSEINKDVIEAHQIIINCTPLGTYPNSNQSPDIPYNFITKQHLLYDLIYNPIQTKFLLYGELRGAKTCNGLRMLELQAERSWSIWNLVKNGSL